MARSAGDLGRLAGVDGWAAVQRDASAPLWTDEFSNILDVLEIRVR
jgi:hypothetical protein